jgi:hypothetical protein
MVDQLGNQDFIAIIAEHIRRIGNQYTQVIQDLDDAETALGSAWLQQIVDDVTTEMLAIFPSIR